MLFVLQKKPEEVRAIGEKLGGPLMFMGVGGIPVGIGVVPMGPMGVNPYAAWGGAQGAWAPYVSQLGGLSHSGPEALEGYSRPAWSDPLLAVKVAQTFPYAQFAVPPVVTLY